ncbi:MAG: hypothetical protein V3R92_00065, partial [Dehalococcoidales bacterium]
FLLQTLNVLPWGLWSTLWRFWPVLLINAGLSILLRRYNTWLVSILILTLLFGSLGIAIWQYGGLAVTTAAAPRSYVVPLDGLERGRVQVDLSAGSLTIGSLAVGSPNFATVASRLETSDLKVDFRSEDGEGVLSLSMARFDRRPWDEAERGWDIRLSRQLPFTLEVRLAVTDSRLDLSELVITDLQMDVDLGNYIVEIPAAAGTSRVQIRANLANLEITIPDGVAARIKTNTSLSALEVDERRFPRKGDFYLSPDFENAGSRVELELDCTLGRVLVK